jgi:hypothetical protein
MNDTETSGTADPKLTQPNPVSFSRPVIAMRHTRALLAQLFHRTKSSAARPIGHHK